MLEAHILKKRREFVIDVTLEARNGAALGVFGASGAGKSSVMACLAGIDVPDGGFVRIDGVQVFPPALPLHLRSIGYLTQDADLFPHLSVAQNVRFSVPGASPADRWLGELRERLALAPIWNAPASDISGGQARRVALARMLARRPSVVLLDEPFSGLDRHIVRGLLEDLTAWQTRIGFCMVVVDHQAPVLERLCSRVIVIEGGRVVQTGTFDQFRSRPATQLLHQLLEPI